MMQTKLTRVSTAFLLALLAVVLTQSGCGKKDSGPGGSASTKNVVVYHILSDIERLNPMTSSDANASYVEQEIWEPLNSQNPRTLETIPCLASLPEVSSDHLIYTYTLDPTAKWSDGQPVTGDDVLFSYKTVKNPKIINGAPLRGYFETLDSAYFPGGDKSKVAFKLSKPYFKAEDVIGGGYVKILPKHIFDPTNLNDKISWQDLKNPNSSNPAIQEFATWFEKPEIARDPKYRIGSGPYKFLQWVTNDRVVIEKNKNYWAMNKPWFDAYPDQIIFKTINDMNSAFTALKRNDLDVLPQLTATQYTQLDPQTSKNLVKDTIYYNYCSFVAWNNSKPMFADKKVRRALTQLIDRDIIVDKVLHNLAKKIEGPIVFTQPNADPNAKQVSFNPDEAKKLLAEAGWTDNDGDGILDKTINGKKTPFKFFALVPSGNETGKQILLVISEQLRKVGIDMQITSQEWAVYLENTKTHNFDAAIGAWVGNASEDDIYQLWHSSQSKNKGSNYYVFKSAEADKIMEDYRTEFDKAKRYEMAHRLNQIILDEQPVSFLFSTPLRIGRVDRFDNVEFSRQRPCFDPRFWIVRGSDQKLLPTAIPQGNLAKGAVKAAMP